MDKLKYTLIQRNKARGIKTWYVRIFNTNTKSIRYVSLNTNVKSEATLLLSQKIQENAFAEHDSSFVTFGEAIDKYFKKCELNGVKKNSLALYERVLGFFDDLRENNIITTTKEEVLNKFCDNVKNSSNQTFNTARIICKSFFKYLEEDLEIPIKNPFAKFKSKKKIPAFKKSFWTMEQIQAILECAESPKHRLFYSFMAYAGLRFFEAKKLKREDIESDRINVVGKGDKVAFVPICQKLKEEISMYEGDFNFNECSSVNTFLKAVKKAGVQDEASCKFHRLRHSFGSNLIRAGANVKSVQLLMRHSNITTTLNVYAHLLDEDLFSSINLLK